MASSISIWPRSLFHGIFKVWVMPVNLSKFHIQIWFSSMQSLKGRKQWHLTPVLLPGKSHGRRSLVGCSPWGLKESDMTEHLNFHFSLSRIGEGNGNPLQCSCLENPRDGGAWWAAIYVVVHSRTRLKRLSSSRSSSRVLKKRAWQPIPVFLLGQPPWTEKPGGLQS